MTSHQTARSIFGRECGVMALLSGGRGGKSLGGALAVARSVGRFLSEPARQKPRFGRK